MKVSLETELGYSANNLVEAAKRRGRDDILHEAINASGDLVAIEVR